MSSITLSPPLSSPPAVRPPLTSPIFCCPFFFHFSFCFLLLGLLLHLTILPLCLSSPLSSFNLLCPPISPCPLLSLLLLSPPLQSRLSSLHTSCLTSVQLFLLSFNLPLSSFLLILLRHHHLLTPFLEFLVLPPFSHPSSLQHFSSFPLFTVSLLSYR